MTPEAEAEAIVEGLFDHKCSCWLTESPCDQCDKLVSCIATALRKYQSRIGELEKGISESHGTLLVSQKAWGQIVLKERALESTNSKLREELNDAYNHLHGTHHCNCDFIASKDEKGCGCAPGKFVRIHFEGCKNPKGEKA